MVPPRDIITAKPSSNNGNNKNLINGIDKRGERNKKDHDIASNSPTVPVQQSPGVDIYDVTFFLSFSLLPGKVTLFGASSLWPASSVVSWENNKLQVGC